MLLYLKQCCVGDRHNDGEADEGVPSLPGRHLSLPTDVDLLPDMNKLQGLSRDSKGRPIPGKKIGLFSSPCCHHQREMEEREPPWSRNKNRGGAGKGGERQAWQAGGKLLLLAGPNQMGHRDVHIVAWHS